MIHVSLSGTITMSAIPALVVMTLTVAQIRSEMRQAPEVCIGKENVACVTVDQAPVSICCSAQKMDLPLVSLNIPMGPVRGEAHITINIKFVQRAKRLTSTHHNLGNGKSGLMIISNRSAPATFTMICRAGLNLRLVCPIPEFDIIGDLSARDGLTQHAKTTKAEQAFVVERVLTTATAVVARGIFVVQMPIALKYF